MRKVQSLHFIHIFAIAFLLLAGVFFIGTQKPYQKVVEEEKLSDVCFSFLQEGEYALEITFEGSPAGNSIVVYSDETVGSDNQAGVEFARQEIKEGAGVVGIAFRLEQGTHNVRVVQELQPEGCRFTNVILQSVRMSNRDGYFLGFLCLFGAAAVAVLGLFVPFEKYRNALLFFAMGIAASIPFLSDTLCAGDDLLYHITRLEGVYQALRSGDFPVRINPLQSAGFGNLSATMYPQLFLYPAAMLRFAGVSAMLCYKLLVVGMNIAAAAISYHSIKGITGNAKMGYAMSVLYTFAIYRLTNIYFRAALGESLAMVFLPLVVWGIYEVLYGEKKKWYLLVLGITGVLQSHVLSFELCILFLIPEGLFWLCFVRKKEWKRLLSLLKATVLTIFVNASFLLPFLYYAGEDFQVFHMESEVPQSGVYLSQMFQLFVPVLGKNLLQGTTQGEMPLSVGAVLGAGAVLFCVTLVRGKKNACEGIASAEAAGKHGLCFAALSLLLASWACPWEKLQELPVLHTLAVSIQFAWRFLGPATVFLCIVSAIGLVRFVSERKQYRWLYGAVAVVLLCSVGYYFDTTARQVPQTADKMELEGSMYSDGMYMYWEGDSFQALQLNYKLEDAFIKTSGTSEVQIADYKKKGSRIQVMVTEAGNPEEYLVFPLYYYPGYEIRVDGEKVEAVNVDTQVACRMPESRSEVTVRFAGLPVFAAADIISLLTVAGIVIYRLLLKLHVAKKPQKR